MMEKIDNDKLDVVAACGQAMRSEDVDEVEQAMLDQLTCVLKNWKASRALGDSTRSLPAHHDDGQMSDTFRHAPHSRRLSKSTLELEVHTLPEPYFECLNDADGQVHPVYRTTPMPKRASPRVPTQVNGTAEEEASCDSPLVGRTAKEP